MAKEIVQAVGWRSPNRASDVALIHDLFMRIPVSEGGAPPGFNPKGGHTVRTDDLIYRFQKRHGLVADAVATPRRETFRLMQSLAGKLPPRRNDEGIQPARVLAVMTSKIVGHAYVKGYDGQSEAGGLHRIRGRFRVPLYELRVGIGEETLGDHFAVFHVLRFGVRYRDSVARNGGGFRQIFAMEGPPRGMHVLKRDRYLGGAWKLKGDFLIHPGPSFPHERGDDTPKGLNKLVGSIGCIQPTGPRGMEALDEFVRRASFSSLYDEGFFVDHDPKKPATERGAIADRRITEAGSFRCLVEPAARPPLLPLTDLTAIGGPPPIRG
ncbi:MAG TPA: hypothetical protein VGV17_05395 [Bosea sp. (in: a-proteobacteria)]|jgi:hypothetical protein|uniref:hypothetical protein n=1 Tax=Bosea sp. (in: a-proteobacteria) TaxID=1871050 RepID=UPI002DDCEABB|nr:hypothetical protein [Bosea sp. (in: a-proteobacteria)]HEV2553180.1 hypothetical protein [Bosea sp. (in: a-proteobacteria)]